MVSVLAQYIIDVSAFCSSIARPSYSSAQVGFRPSVTELHFCDCASGLMSVDGLCVVLESTQRDSSPVTIARNLPGYRFIQPDRDYPGGHSHDCLPGVCGPERGPYVTVLCNASARFSPFSRRPLKSWPPPTEEPLSPFPLCRQRGALYVTGSLCWSPRVKPGDWSPMRRCLLGTASPAVFWGPQMLPEWWAGGALLHQSGPVWKNWFCMTAKGSMGILVAPVG